MALDFEELDEDYLFEEPSTTPETTPSSENGGVSEPEEDDDDILDNQNEEESVLESYLKSKGISDINKIKFENEDGEVEEKDWYSLTKEEQLNILEENTDSNDNDLDAYELDFINRTRLLGVTPQQFIEQQIQRGIDNYVNSQEPATPSYKVDDLSDEALYLLDLEARVGEGELSDEDLEVALEHAKANPELFAKQMKGVREEYKRLEDEQNSRNEAIQREQAEQQYNQFASAIQNEIVNFNSIGELDVDMTQDDMQELASFILQRDNTGMSYFGRALNEPDTLVRLAWFALRGEDMLNDISEYYKKQITSVSRENYKKGFEDAQAGKKPTVVITKDKGAKKPIKQAKQYKSIDDLD